MATQGTTSLTAAEQLAHAHKMLQREVAARQWAEKELRASRDRHRRLIENLPVGLFRKEPGVDGCFLLTNQALVEMFGFESREEFLQRGAADLFQDPADWESFHERLMAEGKIIGQEAQLRKQDGNGLWGRITVNAVRDATGRVGYINGLVEDITERKALENQLAQAQKLEAMGQLAAGIAHEINTPIQYVGDNTRFVEDVFVQLMGLLSRYDGLLAGADIDSDTRAALAAAAEEADLAYIAQEIPAAIRQSLEGIGRVVEIVRAMKDFSHPDTEEKVPTDLNKVIESTVTLARNEWKYVAEMRLDFQADLPPVPILLGDFKQVVLNMIINAAHAIEDAVQARGDGAKGTITVSTRQKGPWAEIRIADTGTGIPPKAQPKIFDLFFTTKPVGKGTGQGLAISRAVVVEKHGGTITFDTKVGKGTTFVIRIPMGGPAGPQGGGL